MTEGNGGNNGTAWAYEKSDQSFLRRFNHHKLLNILRRQGPLSRIALSEISKLDKKTITNIVGDMLESGQVHVTALQQGGGGRPSELLAITGEYYRCLGIDIGGTHATAVIIDFTGKVLASENVDLRKNVTPDRVLDLCDLLISALLQKSGLSIAHIADIGVTFPGILDHATGQSIMVENLPNWDGVPVKRIFEEKYGKRVFVEDCSRAMALAELWTASDNCNDLIVFDLGLGIGCGIVIDGKLFMGSRGKSGEVGHMIVEKDGPLCTCGRHGCIESLASGWALSRCAAQLMREGGSSILKDLVPGAEDEPDMREVVLAAEMGDEACRQLLVRAGEYIGLGIANSISLFNPAKVIFGGRLIKNNSTLMDAIVDTVRRETIEAIYKDAEFTVSALGDNACAIGAGVLCLKEYYNG